MLGPVEIETSTEIVVLPRRRERCLLGVLLLSPNQLFSARRLTDLLWDGHPPDGARRSLHSHVSRVRRALDLAGGHDLGIELASTAHGYQLHISIEMIDAHRFRGILDRASTVTDPAGRIGLLQAALQLWRGPALANAASGWLRDRICADLHEQRRIATEQLIGDHLALGRDREVLPELARLVNAEPGEERFAELYMRALYQSGRAPEALDVYARTRRYLADELGLETSPGLQRLQRQIMRHELPQPARQAGVAVATPHTPPVPRQLPVDVASFAGREQDLRDLDAVLDAGEGGSAPPVAAITGTAGVGKTTLAVHWAHGALDRFPDGQLYANLRGFDPVLAPMEPAEALRGFLDALGVPPDRIPRGQDAHMALYRSLMAERRMFVLLDNARDAAQVRPLLPGGSGCMVVVTSRSRLAGVVATSNAHPLDLDLLSHEESRQLLARRLGPERLVAEPEATDEIIARCARLPLALAVTAARVATGPDRPLAEHARELREARSGLEALSDPDPDIDLGVALGVSYRTLAQAAASLYRLLGLHPGPDFDPYAAAALAGTTLARARHLLDQLLDAHLLQQHASGRYLFHDLIRAHATRAAAVTETEPARQAALTRLLDYYRHAASAAMDTAHPYERERRPRIPPASTPIPDLDDVPLATAWLDTELPNLLAVAQHATEPAPAIYAPDLSTILHRHLLTRGRSREAIALHEVALSAARTTGDRAAEVHALTGLGDVRRLQVEYQQAIDHYDRALRIARAADHPAGELHALIGLGNVGLEHGRYEDAVERYRETLQIARAAGSRVGELRALLGLGHVDRLQGRYERGLHHYQRALSITRAAGDRTGEVNALWGIGGIERMRGRNEQALDQLQQALEIAHAIGDRTSQLTVLRGLGHLHRLQGRHELASSHYGQALELAYASSDRVGELCTLIGLGHVHRLQGRHEMAADTFERARALSVELDDRNQLYEAIQGLGRLHHAVRRPETALAHHRHALDIATDLRQPGDQARAHDGLAHAYRALHQPERAREHWNQALEILTRLGTAVTDDDEASAATIRADLAGLDGDD